jgi:hypothetical protein
MAEGTQRIALLLDPPHGEFARESYDRLRDVLGAAAVTEPDETGFFEADVEAPSFEAALERVWDAVAAAGADDHVFFAEHPDIPEHWRHRVGARPTR